MSYPVYPLHTIYIIYWVSKISYFIIGKRVKFVDCGNFKDATSRVVPIFNIDGKTVTLVKLTAIDDKIEQRQIWQHTFDSTTEIAWDKSVGLTYATFMIYRMETETKYSFSICRLQFTDEPKMQTVLLGSCQSPTVWPSFQEKLIYIISMVACALHLVGDGTVFLGWKCIYEITTLPFAHIFPNDNPNENLSRKVQVYRVDFDSTEQSYHLIWTGVRTMSELFRGNHLYIQWRPYNYRKFLLHKNTTSVKNEKSHHIENWVPDYANQMIDARYNIIHTWTWRFRLYFDDEKFLQSEINNCLNQTNIVEK